MINEKIYYKKIYEKLIVANSDIFSGCVEKNFPEIVIDNQYFEQLYNLLDQVEKKYEFDMQKIVIPNYKKFALWQECYFGKIDIEKIKIATEFIIFCCLVDKFLDSGRFTREEKNLVCQKIVADNFFSSKNYKSDIFIELDILLNNIRKFILDNECSNAEKDKLLKLIDKALVSEVYMYRHPLGENDAMEKKDYHYLIDKSIEFEKSAFAIATYTANNERSENAAKNVGNVFWIIDDLCDLMEDIKYNRKNSLLFVGIDCDEPISISKRIEYAYKNMDWFIEKLINNLNALKNNSSEKFYDYIVNEVWEWCFDIRRMFK